jgi:mono/diheme cytochrome c family protein
MSRVLESLAALALLASAAIPSAAAPPKAPTTAPIPPAAAKEADAVYQTRCIGCHGPTGKGDGAIGAVLNPKPRDLGDAAWQKAVSDEQIEKIILSGGVAVGKSPLMPANSDLTTKPDVLKALRQMVRGFANAK